MVRRQPARDGVWLCDARTANADGYRGQGLIEASNLCSRAFCWVCAYIQVRVLTAKGGHCCLRKQCAAMLIRACRLDEAEMSAGEVD